MHIHILGICGTFMAGIAQLATALGHQVSGSDKQVYPPMSNQLAKMGIEYSEGYVEEQLIPRPDLVIIGNALSRGNPCVEYCLEHHIPFCSGAEWIRNFILKDRWVLAVSGTHGKTTTSSILAWILEFAGLNPGFLIGGVPGNFEASARLGESPFFVIEADEYDTAFFDKRSKFVHYYPRTVIINNLEFDHSDIFSNLAEIQNQFHHLIRTVPQTGLIICPDNNQSVDEVLCKGVWSSIQRFGTHLADWSINYESTVGNRFALYKNQKLITNISWNMIGEHNAYNALAAIAAAHHVGVPIPIAAEALTEFVPPKRRMEVKASKNGIILYDDFAHHPTAISATLKTLRAKVGNERIFALIDLRSNTLKNGDLKHELIHAVNEANEVWIYQSPQVKWDVNTLAELITVKTHVCRDIEHIVSNILNKIKDKDHIIAMSNGSFENLLERIEKGIN